MNTVIAAENALTFIAQDVIACRDEDGRTLSHAKWMLEGITSGYIQYEKAHRWLGYAQAILVGRKVASLSDMKRANQHT